jgi:DnaK suppressor protein
VDDIAEILEDKRARLEAELARMTAPPDVSAAISFGKRVGDGTSMAVDRLADVAAHDKLQAVLADVHRAQVKLSEESYGFCDDCRDSIAPERLEALPWAVLCVRCASRR